MNNIVMLGDTHLGNFEEFDTHMNTMLMEKIRAYAKFTGDYIITGQQRQEHFDNSLFEV